MPKEYQPEALIHFTTRPAVLGILDKGFALIPCDRRLLDDLFGKNRPFVGDPQNFGMICFTDAPLSETREVRKKGRYGLGMSVEWALANGARKVTYISCWKAFVLRQKFKKAMKQMESCIAYPGDEGLKLAFKNKEFAAFMGAGEYATVIENYEYYQTSEDSKQKEWRLTQEHCFYNLEPRTPPSHENWGILYYRKFERRDVMFLICPEGQESPFRDSLPPAYQDISIRTYRGC